MSTENVIYKISIRNVSSNLQVTILNPIASNDAKTAIIIISNTN